MRKIREDEVTFTLVAEDEHIPVRGSFASGDDEADKKLEDEIIARLDSGDIWAWCYVKVTATLTLPDGTTLTGSDGLGGCCYKDQADFCQPGGYFDDMKHEALADLQSNVEAEITRGIKLAEMFK